MIWTTIKLEEKITVLNNVAMFHKILSQSIRLREQTLFQMAEFTKVSYTLQDSRSGGLEKSA